ncbi:MAG: hypothetical protein O3A45_02405 [Proteobacteria bacterium]|nr:hypothetical protein [Pseudomonadota bacterium]
MRPPKSTIQGKPAYDLSSNKYNPKLEVFQPTLETGLASRILPNDKIKNEYIPSPLKQMGIDDYISPGCREVNDLRKVYRGNGLFFNKQLVNASPIDPLSRQGFSDERIGVFGANFKQNSKPSVSTYG